MTKRHISKLRSTSHIKIPIGVQFSPFEKFKELSLHAELQPTIPKMTPCCTLLSEYVIPLGRNKVPQLKNNIMSDDLKRKCPEDPTKINVNQSWELKYWAEKLNVSEIRIKTAVSEIGIEVENVKKYLGH